MDAYLGIGSNLGDREHNIRGALNTLRARADTRVVSVSSLYASDAVVLPGADAQPAYLNAVAHLETDLTPEGLLNVCLEVERMFGRTRSPGLRWEARSLDLDILHIDGVRRDGPDLMLPHPRMGTRAFVLAPLAEIAPSLHLPDPIDGAVEYLLGCLPDAHTVTRLPADEPL